MAACTKTCGSSPKRKINLKKVICLIAFIATCGFGYQAYQTHNLATLLAFLGSLTALLTALSNVLSKKEKTASTNQSIGNNSSGIQVGGNVIINEKDKK